MNELRLSEPSAALLELYQRWKAFTEQEGAGILAQDWVEVRRCQKAKQQLQPQIIRATEQVKNVARTSSGFDERIRDCINELIQLETKNSTTLSERLQAAKEKKGSLDRTSHRLRQVHKSYVPVQGPAWNQYS